AGGNAARYLNRKLLRLEWRFHIYPCAVGRQAQRVGVEMRRGQCGREQCRGMGRAETRREKGGGDDVAQAQCRRLAGSAGASGRYGDIEQGMAVEQLGDMQEMQRIEIKTLQYAIRVSRVVSLEIEDGCDGTLQRADEFRRNAVIG